MKTRLLFLSIAAATLVGICGLGSVSAQRRTAQAKHLAVCGDPNVKCQTIMTFEPYDLPFRMPEGTVIYDTELFYAVILKSVSAPNDNCEKFVPESDRLAAQRLFPNQKVFTSRCAEPGRASYTNTSPNAQFMAVYAGPTLADANRTLATVQATGKFPGANIRRMRAIVNGT